MSDPIDLSRRIPLQPLPLATVALVPFGVAVGMMFGWTAPAGTLLVLCLPTAWSALRCGRSTATTVGLIAVLGCWVEVGWARLFGHAFDLGLVVLASGVLFALSGLLQGWAEAGEELPAETRPPLSNEVAAERPPRFRSRLLESSASFPSLPRMDIDPSEFSALLLALQEVVRRIAGDLDLDTLPETIVVTGANLLDARDCRFLWWHQASRSLVPRATASGVNGPETAGVEERGVLRWVVSNRKIAVRGEAGQDDLARRLFDADPTGPDAVVPLIVGGELLGLLTFHEVQCDAPVPFGLATREDVAALQPEAGSAGESGSFRAIRRGAEVAHTRHARILHLLSIIAHISALALKNALLFRRIEEMGTRDGLTGLRTHANFHEELAIRVEAAKVARAPLAVVIADIDSFKRFNDEFGHQAGDNVLRETARIWTTILPEEAVAGRYGGEEFVCVLPGYDLRRAAEMAETLRVQMELYPYSYEGRDLRATASFGVAELLGTEMTSKQLISLADKALYEAKREGRNRVREAPSASHS